MKKRIFVSIDLPPHLRDYLASLGRPEIRWIKWMKPENFHITLNFLGDLDEEEVRLAKQVLEETTPLHQPFNLTVKNFKSERDMLWLLSESQQNLFNLQEELSTKFKEAGIGKRERRRYVPHVLFAKSKTRRGGQAGRPMTWKFEKFKPVEFQVDKINLYESRLTPEAATHILIQSFALTPTLSPPHEN